MNNLNNFNIFVINLRRRGERRDFFNKQAESIGLNYQYFEGYDAAIDGFDKASEILSEYYSKPFYSISKDSKKIVGRIGCLISHIKLLKYAIDNDLSNIIIMEDDVIIKELDFSVTQEDSLISYLGGKKELYTHGLNHNGYRESTTPWDVINNYKVWETGSYIIEGKNKIKLVYNLLLNIKTRPRAIDAMMIKYIQKYQVCYLLDNGKKFKQNRKLDSDVTFIKDLESDDSFIKDLESDDSFIKKETEIVAATNEIEN
jgi:GR25 family glycosyltransferase involved in LPS biosynthesis